MPLMELLPAVDRNIAQDTAGCTGKMLEKLLCMSMGIPLCPFHAKEE